MVIIIIIIMIMMMIMLMIRMMMMMIITLSSNPRYPIGFFNFVIPMDFFNSESFPKYRLQ